MDFFTRNSDKDFNILKSEIKNLRDDINKELNSIKEENKLLIKQNRELKRKYEILLKNEDQKFIKNDIQVKLLNSELEKIKKDIDLLNQSNLDLIKINQQFRENNEIFSEKDRSTFRKIFQLQKTVFINQIKDVINDHIDENIRDAVSNNLFIKFGNHNYTPERCLLYKQIEEEFKKKYLKKIDELKIEEEIKLWIETNILCRHMKNTDNICIVDCCFNRIKNNKYIDIYDRTLNLFKNINHYMIEIKGCYPSNMDPKHRVESIVKTFKNIEKLSEVYM